MLSNSQGTEGAYSIVALRFLAATVPSPCCANIFTGKTDSPGKDPQAPSPPSKHQGKYLQEEGGRHRAEAPKPLCSDVPISPAFFLMGPPLKLAPMVPGAFALVSTGALHLPPFLSQLSPTHVLEPAVAPPPLLGTHTPHSCGPGTCDT